MSSKVPSVNDQLEESTKEIAHQNEDLKRQLLAIKSFPEKLKCSTKTAEMFENLFPKLKETLCKLFQTAKTDDVTSFISTLIPTIHDTVDATISNFIDALRSLAIGVLDLLLELYKMIHERTKYSEQPALESSLQRLHDLRSKLIGNLMSNNVTYFPHHFTCMDVIVFNRLIFILCEIAEFASLTSDPRLSADAWRCITKLSTEKVITSVDRLDTKSNELNCFEFVYSAVKTGCFCIQNNIQEICESSDQTALKFHSKSIVFVTNILQRLAATFSHDKFQGHEHVLTTYLILIRTIRTFPQYNEFINQNSSQGLQNVLFQICKSKEFVECFHQTSCDEFSIELLQIGMEISKRILDENDSQLLRYFMNNEDVNILCKLLKCFATAPVIVFNKNQIYKDLVVILSSVLVMTSTFNSNIVVRLLVKNVLQSNNISMGYLLIDLWSIWARQLPELQRFNLILFWSKMIEHFSIVQPIHLQSIHIKIVVQNLYDNISDLLKLKLRLNKPVKSNIKLWVALGLHRIDDATNEIVDLHMSIERLYQIFLVERTDSALYKLIEHLRLLETMPQSTDVPVPEYLMKIWNLNFSQEPNKFSPLIIPLIRISSLYKRNLNNHQHFQILRTLTEIASTSNLKIFLKLEILNYLSHVAIKYFSVEYQNEIYKSICQLFIKSFNDSDPIVKQLAFSTYAEVIVKSSHDFSPDLITDDVTLQMELSNFIGKNRTLTTGLDEQIKFISELSSFSIQHECLGAILSASDDEFHVNDQFEIRMKEIVNRMQTDVKELKELSQSQKLTKELCDNIDSLRQELSLIK